MMNVIQIQDALKGMPLEQLVREMQMPSGQAPQFLVLGEIARRKQMEQEFSQRQGQPQTTVAEDAVTAAGVPQQGIASAARAMAPQTDMVMNTAPTQQAPVQGMADGGYVRKMRDGGRSSTPPVEFYTDSSMREMANRQGMTVEELWDALSDETKDAQTRLYSARRPSVDADTTRMPSISDVPALPTAPAMFGGFSIPPEPQPERPALAMRGGEREPRAYAPRGMGMGLEALLNIQNMEPERRPPARQSQFEPPVFDATADFAARRAAEAAQAAPPAGAPVPASSAPPSQLSPPTLAAIMTEFDVSLEDAKKMLENNYGVRYGGEGSSFVIPEHAPPGTAEPLPFFYPGMIPGSGTESDRQRSEMVRKYLRDRRAAQAAAAAAPPPADAAAVGAEAVGAQPGRPPVSMPFGDLSALTAETPPAPEVVPPAPEADPPAPTPPGGIASAMSPFETEITNLLQQREKRAEQDKWLALAQAGMALMSSRQPTFAGALGEAGLVGVEGFRKARDQYEEDRLSLMTAQEKLRAARAAAGARGAASTKAETGAASTKAETRAPVLKPSDIATYYGKRAEIIRNMGEAIDEETKELYRRELIALERAFAAATSAPFDATVGEEG